ncbi:hypothetical protein [Natrinema thermotolerans]|uniref:hypothetical protein n=1 Tax=Natrinema thermotolerans TaxID=121872 RepID=UPI0006785A8A|nr:hypothetical protein [Natrinema thermotolerans]QCC57326.1 hypothetical protein DVR14_01200 [Natrinema thermotolerans]
MADQLSALMVRLTELADARGDVPEDGSGIDGVWTDEVPDVDHDREWLVAINADGEQREYRVAGDREMTIDPYHAHAWWDTDQVVPAAIFDPYGGEQLRPPETFDRSVEDQLLLSVEAALEELGHEFEPTEVGDVE